MCCMCVCAAFARFSLAEKNEKRVFCVEIGGAQDQSRSHFFSFSYSRTVFSTSRAPSLKLTGRGPHSPVSPACAENKSVPLFVLTSSISNEKARGGMNRPVCVPVKGVAD